MHSEPNVPAKTNVSSFLDAFRVRTGSLDRLKINLRSKKVKTAPIPENGVFRHAPSSTHSGRPLICTQSTGNLPNITTNRNGGQHSPHVTAVVLQPILKRSDRMTSSSNTSSNNANSSPKKKAHFKDVVDIYHHDNQANRLLCKESEELKKEYPYVICDRLTDLNDVSNQNSDVISIRHIFRSEKISVVRHIGGKKKLRLVIHLGREFMREKVSVRALKGGQRLVVVGHKHEPLGDGTTFARQYTDKFVLPYAIDPYTLRASLDHAGNLSIEAPVKDSMLEEDIEHGRFDDVTYPQHPQSA